MLLNISKVLLAASVLMMTEAASAKPPYIELDSILVQPVSGFHFSLYSTGKLKY